MLNKQVRSKIKEKLNKLEHDRKETKFWAQGGLDVIAELWEELGILDED